MPIQNFCIECEIEGSTSSLHTQSKKGGFSLTIYQRCDGRNIIAVKVVGVAKDEKLQLDILRSNNTRMLSSLRERLITNR